MQPFVHSLTDSLHRRNKRIRPFPLRAVPCLWLPLGLVLSCLSPAQAQSFTATLQGAVQSASHYGPARFQVGPAASDEGSASLNGPPGSFASYAATADLPQITGNDLGKYGFVLYCHAVTLKPNNAARYQGTYRTYAPGYGYSVDQTQILSRGTFDVTAKFTDPYRATVTGTFLVDNTTSVALQPVKFLWKGPAQFTGAFTSDACGNQSLSGTLQTLPAPPDAPAFSHIASRHLTVKLPSLSLNATSLTLQRARVDGEIPGAFATVANCTGLAGGTVYTDAGLSPGIRYWYRVIAVGNVGSTPGTPARVMTAARASNAGAVGTGPSSWTGFLHGDVASGVPESGRVLSLTASGRQTRKRRT